MIVHAIGALPEQREASAPASAGPPENGVDGREARKGRKSGRFRGIRTATFAGGDGRVRSIRLRHGPCAFEARP